MPDHAISIGIGEYAGLTSLKGPVFDATDFHKWIVTPTGGGLDAVANGGNARLLTSFNFDPITSGPGLSDIYRAFEDLVDLCGAGDRIGDRLFLFFAGHGIASAESAFVAGLVTVEARENARIATDVLKYHDFFVRSGAFDQVFFVFDCCRTVDPVTPPVPPPIPRISFAGRVANTFTAFGSPYGHLARERDFPGVGFRGYLTKAILDGLWNASGDSTGRVTGSALRDFAYNRITDFGNTWTDVPDVHITVDKRYDLHVVTRAAPPLLALRLRLDPASAGRQVMILDGALKLVGGTPVTAAPPTMKFELPAGRYRIFVDGVPSSEGFELMGDLDVDL